MVCRLFLPILLLSQPFFPNFGLGPFTKIAEKRPASVESVSPDITIFVIF